MADNNRLDQPHAQPHFLRRDYHHGLGDGNVQNEGNLPGIRADTIDNLALPRPLPDGLKRNYVRKRRPGTGVVRGGGGGQQGQQFYNQPYQRQQQQPPNAFSPPHLLDGGVGAGGHYGHRQDLAAGNYNLQSGTNSNNDGPWQLSLLFLFAIIGILVFLLLNLLVSDPHGGQRHQHRPRSRRRVSSFTTQKKKTDEWSEDEVDQGNLADNEKGGGVRAGGVVLSSASGASGNVGGVGVGHVVPPPQEGIAGRPTGLHQSDHQGSAAATTYYPHPGYFPQGPQQQHRQRKPQASSAQVAASAAITSGNAAALAAPVSPAPNRAVLDSRPYYKRSPSSRAQQSPLLSPTKAAGASPIASVSKLTFDLKKNNVGGGAVAGNDVAYLGAGLEGFQSPQRQPKKIGATPIAAEKENIAFATPNRVSERQVSVDLESGHPSCSETEDDGNEDTRATGGIVAGLAHRLGDSSPFQSFGSIPSPDVAAKKDVAAETSPAASFVKGAPPPPPRLDISAAQGPTVDRSESFDSPQGLRHRRISSLTSPKLTVYPGHDDMEAATPLVDNMSKKRVRLRKESSTSFDSEDSSRPTSHQALPVPFMPDIHETPSPMAGPPPLMTAFGSDTQGRGECDAPSGAAPSGAAPPEEGDAPLPSSASRPSAMPFIPEFAQPADDSDGTGSKNSHVSAPHSVPIEDLHLIRMESGHGDSFGGKWAADGFDFAKAPEGPVPGPVLPQPKVYEHSYRRQETPLHANHGPSRTHGQIAAKAVLQQSLHQVEEEKASGEGAGEGGNQIKHKRDDLTTWSDSAASLTSPIEFSEIELVSVIGGGGFGQVWKANWRGTPVAVKLMSMAGQTDNVPKKVLQEFVSEINMLSGMRHPNICLYMGACLVPPNRAIVTELAAHGSAWDALRQPLDSPYIAADGLTRNAWPLSLYGIKETPIQTQPGQQWYDTTAQKQGAGADVPFPPSGTWPWALVKRVASGGARGMIYLHSGNPPVLHRDLKSANLLLDDSYTAKIADFGLSRIKATERSMTGNCGTVQWMSPECLASSDYAEPSDVYSFGIILWELLTRECPFDGQTPIQCALAVLNNDARPPIPDWCPPALAELIKKCITRKPSQRPTFEQILATIDGMK